MSPNWGDSQEVINALRKDATKFVDKIAKAFWRTEQELNGKYLESNGWEFVSAAPTKDGINLTIKRISHYIAKYDQWNRDDDYGGGGMFGYDATNGSPVYDNKYITVPAKFIEDFK